MNILLALAVASLFLFYAVLFVIIVNDIVQAVREAKEEDKQFIKLCLDAVTVAVGLVAMGARL